MFRVSLVIPTYNEAKNLPFLIEEIFSAVDKSMIDLEIIIVDDNSPDGTWKIAQEISKLYPVKLIIRPYKLGLGSAVIEGFKNSDRPYVGVMDADLSHDPKILNALILLLEKNDITIGSRFSQGSLVESWKWWRKLLSNVGVFFASRLTKVKDPLSGYFFIRKDVINNVVLKTKGYKILLEILVKGKFVNFKEIPFVFRIRKFSTSKLDYREYLLFFGQLVVFYLYRLFLLFKNKDNLYFLIVFCFSLSLLFYKLSARAFWMDEQAVLEYLQKTPNPLNFIVDYFHFPDNHPPLYYLLVIAVYKVLPLAEVGIRLVSVLSAVGIIIVTYYFSILLFKDKALARLSIVLISLSSYFILISQMARYHTLAAFLMLLSLYYFCKMVLSGYSKKDFISFLVFAILLCYADLPHFIYEVALVNVYYFYYFLKNNKFILNFKKWFFGQTVLLSFFLPIVYLFYLRIFGQNDKGFGNGSLLGGSLYDWVSDFFIHFYVYFFGENILPWNVLPFILGLLVIGVLLFVLIKIIYKKLLSREFYLLLYLFFLSIMLNVIFLNYANPRYNFIVYPKYVFVAFPLFMMLIARLLFEIKFFYKYLVISLLVLVQVIGLLNFYQRRNYFNGSYFNDFKGYDFVESGSRQGDYLIINGDANIGLYSFYKDDYFKNLTPVSFFDLDRENFSSGARFWFFSAGSDGDSVYGSANTLDKIPKGFIVLDEFKSVPIDKTLFRLKQKITGRQSYEYKYGVYLLSKE